MVAVEVGNKKVSDENACKDSMCFVQPPESFSMLLDAENNFVEKGCFLQPQ